MMTSRQLIRWSRLHERRGRVLPPLATSVAAGAALAAWVYARTSAGPSAASHAWLAGAVIGFAVAALRVPFHIYWRADAPLLAQLPIDGRPLFDAALVRCVRAAAGTLVFALIGALPLALDRAGPGGGDGAGGIALFARHAGFGVALGLAAGLLMPAVTMAAAALVVAGGGERVLQAATALGGAPARSADARSTARPVSARPTDPRPTGASPTGASPARSAAAPTAVSPSAILGALPGFAATLVIVAIALAAPWLTGARPVLAAPGVLAAIAGISIVAALAARAGSAIMARILRDVSALDRQRLATLEIRPPTAIERAIGRAIGEAALPYRKDARLMRRRFPIAFALGALVFGALIIVGWARPVDATPWLTAAIAGAAGYGLVLAARLRRPPIELARLSATLPLTASARTRARLAWLVGWWSIFVAIPGVFAALRQADPVVGLGLTAVATIAIIVAGALPR
jgi:hypothetical protein